MANEISHILNILCMTKLVWMQFTSNKTSIYPRYNVSNDNNDRVPQLFSRDLIQEQIIETKIQQQIKNRKIIILYYIICIYQIIFYKNHTIQIIHPHVEISPYKDLEECVCLYWCVCRLASMRMEVANSYGTKLNIKSS